ncbi:Methyltransferase domain-containing protein [Nannocystis exedens]|uniref:Methyltransferase domain-containing protein n=1 Tax=Nannocystis exedens TaxID=54 RepID=A0A1I2F2C1_9BACT|nr:class I SAM-dependent methyltransferase [Nannocystis exedens]PCC69609.1 fibrillarin-like rRNA methylase [Nannocystis exedens]SFE99123.1 Methyltransferase domain-containing protein [Nannocystis exedens]
MRLAPALPLLLLCACAAPVARAGAPQPATAAAPVAAPAGSDAVATASALEVSVKPGINDDWRGRDTRRLVRRLESESREIWVQRERVVEVVAARPGAVVADVGAGSGFLTLLLARAVGPGGKVYALDINRGLLAGIAADARAAGLGNVETLVTPEDGTPLPPDSVDLVFMCDAYHHFEYPRSMMRSLRAALRPGGELVLVELERIPGKTSQAMLDHVRAGKEVFLAELLADGFELVREEAVAELTENYVLRLRKPGADAAPR